jgi:hypothetical protein
VEHVKVGIHDAYRREYQVVKQIGDWKQANFEYFNSKMDIVQLWQQYLVNEKR